MTHTALATDDGAWQRIASAVAMLIQKLSGHPGHDERETMQDEDVTQEPQTADPTRIPEEPPATPAVDVDGNPVEPKEHDPLRQVGQVPSSGESGEEPIMGGADGPFNPIQGDASVGGEPVETGGHPVDSAEEAKTGEEPG